MKKYLLSVFAFLLFITSYAQGEVSTGHVDLMRNHLKFYVVVAVLAVILAGIFIFLFTIDRRLTKLEGK